MSAQVDPLWDMEEVLSTLNDVIDDVDNMKDYVKTIANFANEYRDVLTDAINVVDNADLEAKLDDMLTILHKEWYGPTVSESDLSNTMGKLESIKRFLTDPPTLDN